MEGIFDALVIGAGQSGLATAWHLRRAGLRFVVLEAKEEPGGSWPDYYDSLTLFSPGRYSSLPGMPFPGPPDAYPARDEVVAYLRAYARQFAAQIRTGAAVRRVRRADEGFEVEVVSAPAFRARTVVVATGGFRHPNVPRVQGRELFDGLVIHSSQYRSKDAFRGQRVVVVGAGNSAVQIACELASVARVSLAVRQPVRFRPQRVLGRDLHFWLRWTGLDRTRWVSDVSAPVIDDGRYRAAIRRGQPDERPMFRAFHAAGVEWPDGRRDAVDAVIFATGFRPDVSFLKDLPVLDDERRLRQKDGRSTGVVGIYFVGMPGQRTFASATLRGVGADARVVVRAIVRHLAAARMRGRSRSVPWRCCRPSPA